MLTLLPFDSTEIRAYHDLADVDGLLLKGFYPRLHHMGLEPPHMYGDYFETYVQRDARQLINVRNAGQFERFIRLCAGRTGQLLNLHSLAVTPGFRTPPRGSGSPCWRPDTLSFSFHHGMPTSQSD